MKYGYILAGLFFLINPNISIVDILPDFIGIFLLMHGLEPARAVSPDMDDALQRFQTLFRISVAKFCCMPLLAVIGNSEKTFILVFTFAFSLLELIFMLYAFGALFASFSSLGIRLGGKGMEKGLTGVRLQTWIFTAFRAFFTTIPELSNLPGTDEGYIGSVTEGGFNPFAAYRTLLYACNIFFVLLSGILFILLWARYLHRIRKDVSFAAALADAIRQDSSDRRPFYRRTAATGLRFFCLACVLTSCFITDGVNIIPAFAGGIFLICAFTVLGRMQPDMKRLRPFAYLYTVVSAASFLSSLLFSRKYYEVCTSHGLFSVPKAGEWFIFNLVLTAVSSALFLFLFLRFLSCMDSFLREHCGTQAEKELVRLREKTERSRLRCRNLLRIGAVGVFITSFAGLLRQAMLFVPDPVLYLNERYPVTICLWVPVLLADIAWSIFMFYACGEIREMVNERYFSA